MPGFGAGFEIAFESSKTAERRRQSLKKSTFIFCAKLWYALKPWSKRDLSVADSCYFRHACQESVDLVLDFRQPEHIHQCCAKRPPCQPLVHLFSLHSLQMGCGLFAYSWKLPAYSGAVFTYIVGQLLYTPTPHP